MDQEIVRLMALIGNALELADGIKQPLVAAMLGDAFEAARSILDGLSKS